MVPPTGLILLGITSVQSGSAVAKALFERLPPSGVVVLRLGFAAAVLLPQAWRVRSNQRRRTREDQPDEQGTRRRTLSPARWQNAAVAAALGLTLAGMNLTFYEALDRIPLGITVTIEFCGPLAIAVAASRRRLDVLWVLLGGLGVVLLARGGGAVTPVGVMFAALAGVGWAGYILLTAAVGRRFHGTFGLALACSVGALAVLPLGVASAGVELLSTRSLLLGAVVALLSSVIPYTLELQALRRIPAGVFGLLMSMEPAVAALIGFAVLGEVLSVREWAAIGFVVAACVGATRFGKNRA